MRTNDGHLMQPAYDMLLELRRGEPRERTSSDESGEQTEDGPCQWHCSREGGIFVQPQGSLLIGQRLLTQTGEEAREAVEQERVVKLLRGNGFSQAVLLTRTEVCEHSVTRGKSCLPVCRLKIAAAAR